MDAPILRDIAFNPGARVSAILRTNPGIRSRTLSLRLRQLTRDGLILRVPDPGRRRKVGYELTAKGREVWPVLAALAQSGVRHHAERVFPDASPRNLEDVFPHDATLMLGPIAEFARLAKPVSPRLRTASRATAGGSVVRDRRGPDGDRGSRS